MTPEQIIAAINADSKIKELVPDTKAIAIALSVGRKKLVPTEIGSGTVLASLGSAGISGGDFLDTLVTIGEQNRDVFWTMDLIKQGRLRIDLPATRYGMEQVAVAVPSIAPAITELLKLGYASDPISEFEVRAAIYADDGELKV